MQFKQFKLKNSLKTPLFISGKVALYAAIKSIVIKPHSSIAIPDFYCEEEILALSRVFKISFYKINDNLLPNKKSLDKVLNQNIDLVIIVQYFNYLRDIQSYIDQVKDKKKYVIIDSVHLFYKSPHNIYLNADAIVYSIKKPLFLSEGALVYKKKNFIETNISLSALNPKRNLISFLKFIRLLFSLIKMRNVSNLYSKKVSHKLIDNYPIQSADLVSILIFKIFTNTRIVNFLNNNILFIPKKNFNKKYNENILSFAFIKSEISKNTKIKNYFNWPLQLKNKRSKYWTENAQNIYDSIKLKNPYLDL